MTILLGEGGGEWGVGGTQMIYGMFWLQDY